MYRLHCTRCALTASQFRSPKLLHKLHLLCTGRERVRPPQLSQGVLGRDGQVKTGRLVLADHGLVLGHHDIQSLQVTLEQLNVQTLPGNEVDLVNDRLLM